MAYYSSSYYGSDLDHGYHQDPYGGNYDIVPFPPSEALIGNSSYDFNGLDFFHYDPTPNYNDPAMSGSIVAYSASTFTEPKHLVYDPTSFIGDYNPYVTQFTISYSVSEFNETEFEEYDPTPYDGGYDLTATYGKPLPPSEEICYPRSPPVNPNSLPSDSFSYDSIGSPYGKEKAIESATKPPNGTKPTPVNKDEKEPKGSSGEQQKNDGSSKGKPPLDLDQGEDYHPRSGYGTEFQNGLSEDSGYEKVLPQIPPGYGLEAMDLCENLFGYWPCLSRLKRHDNHHDQQVPYEGCNVGNPWKRTADYLFGSSNPYGERRDDHGSTYGDPMYCYQKHYQEQSLYQQEQVEYQLEDSLQHKFRIF